MHAHYPVFDKGSDWQVVEKICKLLPNVGGAVFLNTFIIKSVDLRDTARLVISPDQEDTVLVPDLVKDEQGDDFNRVEASVNIVTKEEVVCLWELPSHLEQLH